MSSNDFSSARRAAFALFCFIAACGGIKEELSATAQLGQSDVVSLVTSGVGGLASLHETASSELNSRLLASADVSLALVRARALAHGAAQYETVDISTVSVDCPEGGAIEYDGDISFVADSSQVDVEAEYVQIFDDCAVTTVVEAADGECELTSVFDGEYGVSYLYNYQIATSAFAIDSTWTTEAPVELVANGEEHEVEFDVRYVADQSGDASLTGTITLNGTAYDAGAEIDTTEFTREELGCAD